MGGFPFRGRSVCIDNSPFVASCWCFIHSHSIRSDKVPVWSQRLWREYAAMAVSTCTSNFKLYMVHDIMGVLQHSPSLLCNPQIHIRNQMMINAHATQSCTASSTHAPPVKECRRMSVLSSCCFRLFQPINLLFSPYATWTAQCTTSVPPGT